MLTLTWPAPAPIKALTVTKEDNFDAMDLKLPVYWPHQVHGKTVVTLSSEAQPSAEADGVYTRAPHVVCGVKTADCLPIFLCDTKGQEVAVLHAGWRGLASGVIHEGVALFQAPKNTLMAFLGPAICPTHYEIDLAVYDAFAPDFRSCFTPTRKDHWQADLYAIARLQLNALGITSIFGGKACTYENRQQLYSHRQGDTGRLFHLIWIEPLP